MKIYKKALRKARAIERQNEFNSLSKEEKEIRKAENKKFYNSTKK
jgi:hypothetical protein